MSEKRVTVLLCDMPHRREVRAVDSLLVHSALNGKREHRVDVCAQHADMILGGGGRAPRTVAAAEAESVDRIPAGWIDTQRAAEMLDVSKSRVLGLRKAGQLKARTVTGVPGRRGPVFIFERSAVQELARERG